MSDPTRVQAVFELSKLAKAMPQGDFDRLLTFAHALRLQRQGKRQQRYQSIGDRQKSIQENWRI